MRDFKGMKRQRSRNRNPSGGGGGGGGGAKPQQHNANRAFDSNGPEGIKVRGAAQSVYEKYQQLSRDAQTAGDRVLAENYLQHAEHYFRLIRAMQPLRPLSEIIGRDQFVSGYDIDFEDESVLEAAEAADAQAQVQEAAEGADVDRSFTQNRQNDYQRENRPRDDRYQGDRNQYDRGQGDRAQNDRYQNDRYQGDRPQNDPPQNDRPQNERPQTDRPQTDRVPNDRPQADRYQGGQDRQQGDRPRNDRNRDDRGQRNFRDDRPRDDRPRYEENRSRDDRGRDERLREDRPQEFERVEAETSYAATPHVETEAPRVEPTPLLRADDGEVSAAPAFLQARPAVERGEEVRRPRRRRAPASFEPAAETAAPEVSED